MSTSTATVTVNIPATATVTVDVECPPCVPDWQPTGETRCRDCVVQVQEADGCGEFRWTATEESCACGDPYTPTPPPLPSEQTCFDESEKWRVRLTEHHVLHSRTNSDSNCVHVRADRVVKCMVECGIEEFVYCWPLAKPVSVLPPGWYDIYVPAQSAFPLDSGTEVEVTVLLEPVTDDFVTAVGLFSCGSQPCCD